jgi:hypothetical protein
MNEPSEKSDTRQGKKPYFRFGLALPRALSGLVESFGIPKVCRV